MHPTLPGDYSDTAGIPSGYAIEYNTIHHQLFSTSPQKSSSASTPSTSPIISRTSHSSIFNCAGGLLLSTLSSLSLPIASLAMFRTFLPRVTPRASFRSAAPQSVPSHFVPLPSLTYAGRSQRGYASESGASCPASLRAVTRELLYSRMDGY